MSILAFAAVLVLLGTLIVLWYHRTLSPNLMLILSFLFMVGNTELVLAWLLDELPPSLPFIEMVDLEYATILFDLALLAIAGGMWVGQKVGRSFGGRAERTPSTYSLAALCAGTRAVQIYAILFVCTAVLKALISGPLAPLTQLVLPLLMVRLFPLYVLAYRYFTQGRDGPLLLGL